MDIKNDLTDFSLGSDVKVEDRIDELQNANLPVMTTSDLCEVQSKDSARLTEAMNKHLSHFVKPVGNKCVCCGASIGGFFGSFTYTIVHGEGVCSKCGYPARANHYIKDDSGEVLIKFESILQYHPSELSIRSKD